ncbi:unnamed protein product, partial [Brenthis ino]
MSSRTSHIQFLMMVEFMEKNGDLSKPQCLPQGRQYCLRMWKELAELLNSQGIGEYRSEEKWRKVWSDLKNNTKRKWAKINRSVRGTGGGPALKMCLTDLENRVLTIMGVQAATGMPIAEIGFGMAEDTVEVIQIVSYDEPREPVTTPTPIVDNEDWNTPGCSKDAVPVPPILGSFTPPRPSTPLKPTTPPKSPTVPHRQTTSQPPPHKRKNTITLPEYFIMCEENARKYNKERERMALELERERIRQRDIELRQRDTELQLQAQWLEFMKVALNVLDKYFSNKH